MSKKKDPNIILRDKRLRDVVRFKKNEVKKAAKFGCAFLDRMIEEDYELMERVIRLEHFVWKVEVEPQKDEKTGEVYANVITLGELTEDASKLDKKDLALLQRQHKHMTCYEATLEKRMERLYKTLEAEAKAGDKA